MRLLLEPTLPTMASPELTPIPRRISTSYFLRHVLGGRLEEVHHVLGRGERSIGVIGVRHGRAPHGHDAVADELVDGAAVPEDDLGEHEKSSLSIVTTCSGGRLSASGVKATTSAKSTVIGARSPPSARGARPSRWRRRAPC
jgi:hypothetical protein